MSSHVIALLVAIPLISAPLCILLHRPRLVWGFTVLVNGFCFFLSVLLLQQVLEAGTVRYALGGWLAPIGIEYRADTLTAYVTLFVTFLGTMVSLYSRRSVEHEIPKNRITLFYTAYQLCITGLLGITMTGDAFNLFVFLEISSLSSYALISLGKSRKCLLASFRYLIMGTTGATFILIGVGLLYAHTGSLNMDDIGRILSKTGINRTVEVAFAFITLGIAIKIALFPFHLWLPRAYAYAPSVVTALLAATATKVAIYALIRFIYSVFGQKFSLTTIPFGDILMALAIIAILYGSVLAILQTDIKKLFAWSSVAQVGYMILGISLVSVTGLQAGLVHMFNHALIKCTLFLLIAGMVFRWHTTELAQLGGLAKRMPLTAAGIVVTGLSLVGVPLTAGFVSKWYLISAALEKDLWWLVVIIVFSSLLALVYVWKVIEVLYFKPVPVEQEKSREISPGLLIPVWILVLLNIGFGLHTWLNAGVARTAANQLFGG